MPTAAAPAADGAAFRALGDPLVHLVRNACDHAIEPPDERVAAGKPARYGPDSFPAVPWPETLMVTPPWEGGDGRVAMGR